MVKFDWRSKTRWFAAELLVVVSGVLIALAVNSWWVNQQKQESERVLVTSLLEEFSSNKIRLGQIQQFHIELRKTVETLLDVSVRPSLALSSDSIDQLIVDVSWWASYTTLQTTIMDTAVLDGQISLVRTDSLRHLISMWRSSLESAKAQSTQEITHYSDTWLPLLRENTDLAQLSNRASRIPGSNMPYQGKRLTLSPTRTSHKLFIESLPVRNALVHKFWIENDIIYQYGELEIVLDRVIKALQNEVPNFK